jgi:23S rRNA (guanosine2251-2'-O)-methyltransferase
MLVVGNEREGLPRSLLDRCDSVIAVPMAGFVPSYNVQAALSIVAAERLRQLEAGR